MISNLPQLQHENDTWKQLLEFFQEENVYLKNTLSNILRSEIDNNFLERAEYFQNQFLSEDQKIAILRSDVNEQNKLLLRELFEDGAIIKEVIHKHTKLRKDIEIAEKTFNKLKTEFENYLSEAI
jgi:hypothetical protein